MIKMPEFLRKNNYYLLKIFGLLFVIGIFLIIGWQFFDWFLPLPVDDIYPYFANPITG